MNLTRSSWGAVIVAALHITVLLLISLQIRIVRSDQVALVGVMGDLTQSMYMSECRVSSRFEILPDSAVYQMVCPVGGDSVHAP